jgi:hypothetical protein
MPFTGDENVPPTANATNTRKGSKGGQSARPGEGQEGSSTFDMDR